MHRTRLRTGRARRGGALAAAVALGSAAAAARAGGGDWIEPARDRYEAGQTVTMIGYGRACRGCASWTVLRLAPRGPRRRPRRRPCSTGLTVHPTDLRVGEPVLEEVPGRPTRTRAERPASRSTCPRTWRTARTVVLCNDPCTDGRLLHRGAIHVGVDPPYPIVRDLAARRPGHPLARGRRTAAAQRRAGRSRPPRCGPGTVSEPAPPVMPVPAAPPPTVDPRRPSGGGGPRPGRCGRAGRRTGRGEGTPTAATGDGGAAAWWVAAEATALVGGGIGAMAWVGRRRRRGGRSAPSSPRLGSGPARRVAGPAMPRTPTTARRPTTAPTWRRTAATVLVSIRL